MNKPTSRPWWASLGFGPAEPDPDPDYADMGTAFGLDASMRSLPSEGDSTAPDLAQDAARRPDGARRR